MMMEFNTLPSFVLKVALLLFARAHSTQGSNLPTRILSMRITHAHDLLPPCKQRQRYRDRVCCSDKYFLSSIMTVESRCVVAAVAV
jgi:hypothetical protein